MTFFKNLVLIIVAPEEGWKRISEVYTPQGVMPRQLLYPLLGVLALSCFVRVFVDADYTMTHAMLNAFAQFASYTLSMLVCIYLLPAMFGEANRDEANWTARVECYISYLLSYLVVLNVVQNLLPTTFAPIDLLAIYVVYLAFRGVAYVKHNGSTLMFVTVVSVLIFTQKGLYFVMDQMV